MSFRRGQYIFDENLIFGTIGISDYIVPFNSVIIKTEQRTTGLVARYDFHLKTRDFMPLGTYFVVHVPSYYTIGDLQAGCKILPEHPLECSSAGNTITISGVEREFEAMEEWVIQLELVNPAYALFTEHFRVLAYRERTTLAYAWRSSVLGVDIQPTRIAAASLSYAIRNVDLCRNMVMDVRLTFTPVHSGRAHVQVPANFYLVHGKSYDRVRPVDDYLIDDTTISFASTLPGGVEHVVELRIRTQQVKGTTASFQLSILNDDGVVDQIATGLTIDIQDYGTIGPFQATLSNGFAGGL